MIEIINLTNGEQIIGDIEDLEDRYKVTSPFYIVDSINDDGLSGFKLTNVLTFSSVEYIVVSKEKVVFTFPVTKLMATYYGRLRDLHSKTDSDFIINEAIAEMDAAEERYQKLMDMIKIDKTKLN